MIGNHLIHVKDIMLNKWTGNIIIQKDTDISKLLPLNLYINFIKCYRKQSDVLITITQKR
jgi:hypothetical protein